MTKPQIPLCLPPLLIFCTVYHSIYLCSGEGIALYFSIVYRYQGIIKIRKLQVQLDNIGKLGKIVIHWCCVVLADTGAKLQVCKRSSWMVVFVKFYLILAYVRPF